MELRDVRAFVTTVDVGGVTRAARQLHMVQSAVSQAVRRLERGLGVELLERRRDGVRPTEAGALLYEHGQVILNAVARAEADLAAFKNLALGAARIGIVHTATPLVLPPLLRRVNDRLPGLTVDVEEGLTGRIIDRLRLGHLDVAIFYMPIEADGFSIAEVATHDLVAVMSSAHPLARRRRVRLGDLAGEGWVSFPRPNPGRRWLDEACAESGFAPRIVAEIETLGQMKAFVETGAGIALMPASAFRAEVQADMLSVVAIASPTPTAALGWARRPGNPSPAAAAVCALLSDLP